MSTFHESLMDLIPSIVVVDASSLIILFGDINDEVNECFVAAYIETKHLGFSELCNCQG